MSSGYLYFLLDNKRNHKENINNLGYHLVDHTLAKFLDCTLESDYAKPVWTDLKAPQQVTNRFFELTAVSAFSTHFYTELHTLLLSVQ